MKEILKYTIQGNIEILDIEDGGQAIICEPFPINTGHSDDENGMFIKLQSWDEDTVHKDFNLIKGKKVKITLEFFD